MLLAIPDNLAGQAVDLAGHVVRAGLAHAAAAMLITLIAVFLAGAHAAFAIRDGGPPEPAMPTLPSPTSDGRPRSRP